VVGVLRGDFVKILVQAGIANHNANIGVGLPLPVAAAGFKHKPRFKYQALAPETISQFERNAQRQFQAHAVGRRWPGQQHFQARAELQQGVQVRHAGARRHVVGAGRQRHLESKVEVHALGVEQARTDAGAVGTQHFAAIDQQRQHKPACGTVGGSRIGRRRSNTTK